MADKRFVKYGDQEMELPAEMTLDAAKQQMSRFFPELADPSVETKKEKGRTVYIFTKRAGHKGSDDLLWRVERGMTTQEDAAVVKELIDTLSFCKSVIKSQGMYDLSERMAYDKAEAALQKVGRE